MSLKQLLDAAGTKDLLYFYMNLLPQKW